MTNSTPDPKRELLRHALATLAYRASQALRGAPPDFGDFAGAGKTPVRILAHMSDVLEWGLTVARGDQKWQSSEPMRWDGEVARFFAGLGALDAFLASDEPLGTPAEKLLQAPIADCLTHTGQLAMLRRLAGCPMPGQNYFVAAIETGRVGIEQTAPAKTFA
jgi:hypothetical protein